MIDWFKSAMCEAASDVPADKMAELSKLAEAWLRTGAAGISWREWQELDPQSRAAFVDAGNRLWTERACIAGLANQSKGMALRLLANVDGGRGIVADAMTRVMEESAQKLEAEAS